MAPSIFKMSKRFGSVNVIHGIDIDIKDGEFVSSSARPAAASPAAHDRRAGGAAAKSIGARVSHLPAHDRDIAMVFQNYALYHAAVRIIWASR